MKKKKSDLSRIVKTGTCNNPKHRWAFFVYNALGVIYLITMLVMVPYIRNVDTKIADCCYYAQEFCDNCVCHGYYNRSSGVADVPLNKGLIINNSFT